LIAGVKLTKEVRAEVDFDHVVLDGLKAEVLVGECPTNQPDASGPAAAAAVVRTDVLAAGRMLPNGRRGRREGWAIKGSGQLHLEPFVGTDMVVAMAPTIKTLLLGRRIWGWGQRGFALQNAMRLLMGCIILRAAWPPILHAHS
jgi:hypothetical protein